ncbi:mitotic spindle assembly checkpoint protein MAD1 isoform X3 [Zootermopsis nevadensis]|uniref:mitotic spindle assembly checkpoint protein MAD1 isoform X3 n=1 Tax=Zootermopsis nevadensis TaxID=136037 RepID=UPI000B8E6B6B|nr:mitotic spindle assembly checkpoint protein MAD1 isoform X3 [Zootermopsis nevadensis]
MFESQDTEDPTCVIKMLDEFRQCNPTVNRPNFIDMAVVPTILQFDDCVVSHDSKKRKHTDSNVSVDTAEDSNISVLASPWETRRMKAELAEAKALNASLEERIKKLHSVRMELELVFDNEKTSFLKQRERDREIIRMLEGQIATLRKREVESRDEFSQYRQSTESSKCKLEKKILRLQEEYTHLDDRFKQELKLEQDKGEETRELLEKQHHNLMRLPDLEREVASLRDENRNLRDAVRNKLVLEEEVVDLRSRQAGFELREQKLAQLDASQGHLESMLEHWRQLARDHCLGVPPEKAMAGPEFLRMRIETLQQKELQLTADLGDLGIRLKTAQQAKSKVEMELDKATKQIERLQVTNDDQSKLIKRLQKRLLLVSRERDSYRSQLDMYEKELTVTSSSALLNSQQQQQRSRVEALEKTVDGYRDLVMKLEADLEKAVKGSGGIQFSERIYKLEEERNTLQQEKEQLMKRRDELEVELEYRALKGDFNPMKSKVLHIRMNPAATVEAQREDKLTHLQQECNRLQERVRVLEGGQMQDVTQEVNLRLAASSTQEVQELQEQVKSYETKLQRLKEAFKTTSQEYREVCYMLLGYKIDRIKSSLYRLSSMYAESQDDYLLFKLADGNPELLETPYSATLEQFINLHLKHQHSIPVFLSAITIDLFGHQTE